MSFESFAQVLLPESVLAHIWEGENDDPSLGGHRFGLGREGKTEFPESWTREMVSIAIRQTLATPQSVKRRARRVSLMRVVDAVVVVVLIQLRSAGDVVTTAYPRSGDGVIINVWGRAIPVPLDVSALEA